MSDDHGGDGAGHTRRRWLSATAGIGVAALAGCFGTGTPEETPTPTPTEDDIDPALRLNGRALTSSFPLRLQNPGDGAIVTEVHWHGPELSHWHFQPLEVPLGDARTLRVVPLDRELEPIPLGDDETYQVAVRRTEETPAELLEVAVTDDGIELRGTTAGDGHLVFELQHNGDRVWLSPPLETVVE